MENVDSLAGKSIDARFKQKTFTSIRMFKTLLAEDVSHYLITQCGSNHEIRQALQANIVGDFRIDLKFINSI